MIFILCVTYKLLFIKQSESIKGVLKNIQLTLGKYVDNVKICDIMYHRGTGSFF